MWTLKSSFSIHSLPRQFGLTNKHQVCYLVQINFHYFCIAKTFHPVVLRLFFFSCCHQHRKWFGAWVNPSTPPFIIICIIAELQQMSISKIGDTSIRLLFFRWFYAQNEETNRKIHLCVGGLSVINMHQTHTNAH